MPETKDVVITALNALFVIVEDIGYPSVTEEAWKQAKDSYRIIKDGYLALMEDYIQCCQDYADLKVKLGEMKKAWQPRVKSI